MFERSRKGEHALLIQPHAGGPPDDGAAEEFTDLARMASNRCSMRACSKARSAGASTSLSTRNGRRGGPGSRCHWLIGLPLSR